MAHCPAALGLCGEGDRQPVNDLDREHECLDQQQCQGNEYLNERQQSVEVECIFPTHLDSGYFGTRIAWFEPVDRAGPSLGGDGDAAL